VIKMEIQNFFIILLTFLLCIVPSYSELSMKGKNNPYKFNASDLKRSFIVPTEPSKAVYCHFDITQGSLNVDVTIGTNPFKSYIFHKSNKEDTQFVITSENFKNPTNVCLAVSAIGNFTNWSGNIACHNTLKQTEFMINDEKEFQVPMKIGEIALLKSSSFKLYEQENIGNRIFISVRIGLAMGCTSGDMPHYIIFSNHSEFNRGSLKKKILKEETPYKAEFCNGPPVDFPTGEIYVIIENAMPRDSFYYPRMTIFPCHEHVASFLPIEKEIVGYSTTEYALFAASVLLLTVLAGRYYLSKKNSQASFKKIK